MIKEKVKNIFNTNAFETALELTKDLRGEYIRELGVKSWNALASYYKKANIQPEIPRVCEPENRHSKTPPLKQYSEMKQKHPDAILLFRVGDFYETFSEDAIVASEILGITLTRRANGKDKEIKLAGFPHHSLDSYLPKLIRAGKRVAICEQLEDPKQTMNVVEKVLPQQNNDTDTKEGLFSDELATSSQEGDTDILIGTITPDNVGELHNTLAGTFGEEQESAETKDPEIAQEKNSAEELSENVEEQEEERVEYMLYQNDGEKVDWYGHFVNFKGLKVGESGMMVRMNNLGVGRGKVLATAYMTMKEIGMFHKCYASIRQRTASDNKRVELFTKAFNNLQSAMRDPKFATLSTGYAIAHFVLNYKKED